jgi:hypothetical protein
VLVACDSDDAQDSDDAAAPMAEACEPREPGAGPPPEPASCTARDGDYAPCTDDGYARCVSDDGDYHRVEDVISTIARVGAFEEIAELLFDPTRDAGMQDFLDARALYQENEGLDSRVVRRFDPHFEIPEGTDCTLPDTPAMYPDYCVGPAILQPLLLDAFNAGTTGEPPRLQAGRIEGALLWFLYVSTYKESFTCTTTAKDCDSAYAYYTGGESARGGLGLSRLVREVDPYAHDRAWDGVLAVRCWRDLDDAETASDFELRERARTQYDLAVIDGVAALVDDRLERLSTADGAEREHYFGFIGVLGQALDHAARARDEDHADTLRAAVEADSPDAIDVDAARAAIAALFECP